MNLQLKDVTEENFLDVVNLKSDKIQEQKIQIYERWVGSNVFFLGVCHVYGFTARAVYDDQQLIGFVSYGYNKKEDWYQIVSIMLGHQYQSKGYGIPTLNAVIDEMVEKYQCDEIYLTVIHNNEAAIKTYEKLGFIPTGQVIHEHHDELVLKKRI